jgi:hypothetical protein
MMDELLNKTGEELLRDERVVTAYWRLKPYPAELREIPPHLSVADVAFEMRDACFKLDFIGWEPRLEDVVGTSITHAYRTSKPEHWVIAAVLAWESKAVGVSSSRLYCAIQWGIASSSTR